MNKLICGEFGGFFKQTIRKKSVKYPSDFLALDLWTSNKIIVNRFLELSNEVNLTSSDTSNQVDTLSGKLAKEQQELENKLTLVQYLVKQDSSKSTSTFQKKKDMPAQVTMAEKFCVNAVSALNNQVKVIMEKLTDIEQPSEARLMTGILRHPEQAVPARSLDPESNSDSMWKAEDENNNKMTFLVSDFIALKSRSDSDIVRFGGLGFSPWMMQGLG